MAVVFPAPAGPVKNIISCFFPPIDSRPSMTYDLVHLSRFFWVRCTHELSTSIVDDFNYEGCAYHLVRSCLLWIQVDTVLAFCLFEYIIHGGNLWRVVGLCESSSSSPSSMSMLSKFLFTAPTTILRMVWNVRGALLLAGLFKCEFCLCDISSSSLLMTQAVFGTLILTVYPSSSFLSLFDISNVDMLSGMLLLGNQKNTPRGVK